MAYETCQRFRRFLSDVSVTRDRSTRGLTCEPEDVVEVTKGIYGGECADDQLPRRKPSCTRAKLSSAHSLLR